MSSGESFKEILGINPPDGKLNSKEMILRDKIEESWETLLQLNHLQTVGLIFERGENGEYKYFLTGKMEEVVSAKKLFNTIADDIRRMYSEKEITD